MAGIVASVLLLVSILFLPWFSLTEVPERGVQNAWVCGVGDHSCTAWETFPILRWLMILLALAPAILGYILIRGHKLSYPPGEITMLAGFAGVVLIGYNGILFKPEPEDGVVFGTGLEIGYFVAVAASLTIGMIGFMRSMDSGGKQQRKAPGTV